MGRPRNHGMTRRETQVVDLYEAGAKPVAIAAQLGISRGYVLRTIGLLCQGLDTLDAERKAMVLANQTFVAALEAERSARKRCRGNLRPAPFFLSPDLVRRTLALQLGNRTMGVPIEPTELVDSPRAALDPYPFRDHRDQAGQVPEVAPKAASKPAPKARKTRLKALSDTARRSDVEYRQARQRDARELERPVDEVCRPVKLAPVPAPAQPAKPVPERSISSLPPVPVSFADRRARLEAAIAWLKFQCILVTPVDRFADIRTYRVSGRTMSFLAEDVIALAHKRGMTA